MRKSTRRALPTLVLSAVALCLVLAACSGGGLQVQMDRNGSQVTVTVTDHTGLIRSATGGSPQTPDPLPAAPALWNPSGDLTRVSVYWQGTACSQHPTLDLSGNALVLKIDPGPAASGCSDTTLLPNIVTLSMRNVIDVTAVTVKMVSP